MPARTSNRRAPASALVAVAAALTLLAAPAGAGATATPSADYVTAPVPAVTQVAHAARAGAASTARSLTLRSPHRFSLAALRWTRGAAAPSGRMRAHKVGGGWTQWFTVGPGDGAVNSTDPTWTGPATALELQLTGAVPRGLKAAFVQIKDPQTTTAHAARADAATDGILPRADWDPANNCAPKAKPTTGQIQVAVVHHTDGSNDYTEAQVPSIILAICKFHEDGNGWNDIGYNVLVDRFGVAWEGRAGGLTLPIVGAQAQGFNAQSTGISMLGDFDTVPPTPAQLATVEQVAAWKLALAGVPRTGTVNLTSGGGPLSRYGAGKVVTEPRVVGHRDLGETDCPGTAAYALLPQIRTAVAAANPALPTGVLPSTPTIAPAPKITISTARRLAYGTAVSVKGSATQSGAPLRQAKLALQVNASAASSSGWMTVATTSTTSAGRYAFARKFSRSWAIRVAQTAAPVSSSSAVQVAIVPKLTLTVPKRMVLGKRIKLRGLILPGRGPVTLEISRRNSNGTYTAPASVPATLTGRVATAVVVPHSATLYRFRLRFAGNEFQARSSSAYGYGRAVSGSADGGASL
jgi:uncharacterized protein with LGFP repeats